MINFILCVRIVVAIVVGTGVYVANTWYFVHKLRSTTLTYMNYISLKGNNNNTIVYD